MQGRSGYAVPGGWASSSSNSYHPSSLSISSRSDNTPAEYVAIEEIAFVGEFESGVNDEYTAYLSDGSNSNSSGGNDANGVDATGLYRYGFNGKERDGDIEEENYDFGARIYDGRLGRWLSTDPLQRKYPGMSPYNFTANNPMLYVDRDGRDYIVYIDHTTKTIIIKATYHTVKGDDASNAHQGAKKWNDESNKWRLGYNSTGEKYSIRFELTVKEYDDAAKRDAAFTADKSGEANKLISLEFIS